MLSMCLSFLQFIFKSKNRADSMNHIEEHYNIMAATVGRSQWPSQGGPGGKPKNGKGAH